MRMGALKIKLSLLLLHIIAVLKKSRSFQGPGSYQSHHATLCQNWTQQNLINVYIHLKIPEMVMILQTH